MNFRTFFYILSASALGVFLYSSHSNANEYEERLKSIAQNDIRKWAHSPEIIKAIKESNNIHYNLSLVEIEKLDKEWQLQLNNINQPLIYKVYKNTLSELLKKRQFESDGLYREIIAMDNRGLNAGISVITSDYWQGDEAKFTQTYKIGISGMHVGDIAYDDSAQAFQSQVSITIFEGDEALGAITVGIDTEQLERRR